MNFSELTNEVILITRRPDLQALTESAVRASTLKAHQKDFFYRDIKETGVEFATPATTLTFEPKELIPRYRHPAYIREWLYDPTDTTDFGQGGRKFTSILPSNAKDRYGCFRTDVYYLAGSVIQIRSSTPVSHILFGAYLYPDVGPDSFSSWIADEYPWAIIHDAARHVFYSIGAQEQARKQETLVAEQYTLLTINSIETEAP